MRIILRQGRAARRAGTALVAAAALWSIAPAPRAAAAPSRLAIVVGESSWGSLVAQVAGRYGAVTSLVANPATDPHDYEPTASDARRVASARYVVENGIGYDPWLGQLLDAEPDASRRVLDVGRLLHLDAGDNPHQWYDPAAVDAVVRRVGSDLAALDHAHAGYYRRQAAALTSEGLRAYHDLVAAIRHDHAGVSIGGSESIVAPLAHALGLRLVTPSSFLDAVSEGADPTARDIVRVQQQIDRHAIRVFVYNRQNETPGVHALVDRARGAGIPVVAVTETLTPVGATFQDWQVAQLRRLDRALAPTASAS